MSPLGSPLNKPEVADVTDDQLDRTTCGGGAIKRFGIPLDELAHGGEVGPPPDAKVVDYTNPSGCIHFENSLDQRGPEKPAAP